MTASADASICDTTGGAGVPGDVAGRIAGVVAPLSRDVVSGTGG